MANQYGRPLKGKAKRLHITVSADPSTVEEIDKYVELRQQEQPSYSRSDFYEEAAMLLLQEGAYQNRTTRSGE